MLSLALPLLLVSPWATPLISDGFDHFYNLEFPEAIHDFERAVAENPKDPDLYNDVAQGYLFREMFRAGALESEWVTGQDAFLRRPQTNASPADQRKFDDAINKAMALADERLSKNPRDVGALYAKGVSLGLRANYNFLVRRAWIGALRDATNSRKYHTRVTDLDPSFVDAMLVQGTHDYIVGSLPFYYRMLGFVAGFHGDREKGIQELEYVRLHGTRNRQDAEILLAAIYRRERRPTAALPLLRDLIRQFPRNY